MSDRHAAGNRNSSNRLEVRELSVSFSTYLGVVRAVRGVSFDLRQGETMALVGESGSGKTVTCRAVMRLLAKNASLDSGSISLDGTDLLKLNRREMRDVRGNDVAMIFQDPMTSLNPTMKIGRQIGEAVRLHNNVSRAKAKSRALELLDLVGIEDPARRYHQYPHQFSGGQRQRVVIAIALACDPKVLIADEPTTALDVTIQAQILDLLRGLKDRLSSAIMLITHDLGVIAEMADFVVVMYAGKVVEKGTTKDVFLNPAHPYTMGLMASKPVIGREVDRLYSIPGSVPNPINMPDYCYFRDRCPNSRKECLGLYPPEIALNATHFAACYRAKEGAKA